MPAAFENQFLLIIAALCCCVIFLSVVILFLLLRMDSRIVAITTKLNKSNNASKIEEPEAPTQGVEAEPGTPFDDFLKEHPGRRALSKKEQFNAYRKWRQEKGLNWVVKD